jgi:hypothetical protein
MLRENWQIVSQYGSAAFSHVWAFFSAYPPLAQGLYYLLIGLWPFVNAASYQRFTGHGDLSLVEVIGVLQLVVGGALCLAAYRRQGSPEVLFLAFGSALGLTAVDIHLVVAGLSFVYLLDAALQLGLVAFWVYGWRKGTVAAVPVAPVATPVPPAAPADLQSVAPANGSVPSVSSAPSAPAPVAPR